MVAVSDRSGDSRGSAIVVTAEELAALFGVGPIGMALYLVLRAQMDFGTGLVGSACPISLHGLAVCLERHVPRGLGVQRILPSEKDVRMGLDGLARNGLIERVGNSELLVFRLLFARVGNVRQFQTGHSAGANAGTGKASNSKALRAIPGTNDAPNRAHIRDQGIAAVNKTAASPGEPCRAPVDKSSCDAAADISNSEEQKTMAQMGKILELLKAKGVEKPSSGDRRVRSWVDRGYTQAQLKQSIDKARLRRASDGSAAPINVGLIDTILGQDFAGKGMRDDLLVRAKAAGVAPRPGESWPDFRKRAAGLLAGGADARG
jgi:hypothetical protein